MYILGGFIILSLLQVELVRALESTLGSSFSSEPLAPPPNPQIIVISGPSGVGKDAVIKVWLCSIIYNTCFFSMVC